MSPKGTSPNLSWALVHGSRRFNLDRREAGHFDSAPKIRLLNRLAPLIRDAYAACIEVHGNTFDTIDTLDRASDVEASARSRHAPDQYHRVGEGLWGRCIRPPGCMRRRTSHWTHGQQNAQDTYTG